MKSYYLSSVIMLPILIGIAVCGPINKKSNHEMHKIEILIEKTNEHGLMLQKILGSIEYGNKIIKILTDQLDLRHVETLKLFKSFKKNIQF